MGLTRGTTIRLNKVAPMGDPVEISVRDFSLSLRKDEARVLLLAHEAPDQRPEDEVDEGGEGS